MISKLLTPRFLLTKLRSKKKQLLLLREEGVLLMLDEQILARGIRPLLLLLGKIYAFFF